jgi:hypothetical protein
MASTASLLADRVSDWYDCDMRSWPCCDIEFRGRESFNASEEDVYGERSLTGSPELYAAEFFSA